MDFIRLTDPAGPEFETAFALYEVSFPVHERRTRAAQTARDAAGKFQPAQCSLLRQMPEPLLRLRGCQHWCEPSGRDICLPKP